MTGLDANVLRRVFVDGEPVEQRLTTRSLLSPSRRNGAPLGVLVETIRTMRRAFDLADCLVPRAMPGRLARRARGSMKTPRCSINSTG
jgi:hypothetical protein